MALVRRTAGARGGLRGLQVAHASSGGMVLRGEWWPPLPPHTDAVEPSTGDGWVPVAVKVRWRGEGVASAGAGHEADVLSRWLTASVVDGRHIIRLLGTCSPAELPLPRDAGLAHASVAGVGMILPWADGGDSGVAVAAGASTADVVAWASQVASAVAAAHAAGVLHRDIKPSNVLLMRQATGGLQAVLADWGVACRADDSVACSVAAGSPAFMAPEVAAGQHGHALCTTAADVWSMGACLLAWLDAVGGRSHMRAAVPVADRHPLSSVAREVASWCMREAPSVRPAAADVAARLQAALGAIAHPDRMQHAVETPVPDGEAADPRVEAEPHHGVIAPSQPPLAVPETPTDHAGKLAGRTLIRVKRRDGGGDGPHLSVSTAAAPSAVDSVPTPPAAVITVAAGEGVPDAPAPAPAPVAAVAVHHHTPTGKDDDLFLACERTPAASVAVVVPRRVPRDPRPATAPVLWRPPPTAALPETKVVQPGRTDTDATGSGAGVMHPVEAAAAEAAARVGANVAASLAAGEIVWTHSGHATWEGQVAVAAARAALARWQVVKLRLSIAGAGGPPR